MKLGGSLLPGHATLLFSISGTGSFICPVTQTRLDIPRRVLLCEYIMLECVAIDVLYKHLLKVRFSNRVIHGVGARI